MQAMMLDRSPFETIAPLAQRSHGSALVTIKHTERGDRLGDLFQKGCAKIRLPKVYHGQNIEAVMINTSGGMTGGDELSWRFKVEEDAALTVTTQACERVYQASAGCAHIRVELEVEENATLFWLPQETILFEGSNVHREIDVRMNGNARILMVEPLLLGRKEMGESLSQVSFMDEWRVTHKDQTVHREATRLDGNMKELFNQRASLEGNLAVATVLLLAPAQAPDLEAKLEAVRSLCTTTAAASYWQVGETGKILARVMARDGYELRKALIPLVQVLSDDATLPKTWSL